MNHNIRNGNANVNLFEIGKEYKTGKKNSEIYHLTGVLHGDWISKSVHNDEQRQTIHSLKGKVEALFNRIKIKNISFSTTEHTHYKYGLSIALGKSVIGHCGKLKQSILNNLDINADEIFGFDIELKSITDAMKNVVKYSAVSPYPKVGRDMNFVLDKNTKTADISYTVLNAGGQILISVKPVDIFHHKSLGENKKSVTFHLEFQSAVKTLEEAEINSAMNDITAIISKQFDAKLRD